MEVYSLEETSINDGFSIEWLLGAIEQCYLTSENGRFSEKKGIRMDFIQPTIIE